MESWLQETLWKLPSCFNLIELSFGKGSIHQARFYFGRWRRSRVTVEIFFVRLVPRAKLERAREKRE